MSFSSFLIKIEIQYQSRIKAQRIIEAICYTFHASYTVTVYITLFYCICRAIITAQITLDALVGFADFNRYPATPFREKICEYIFSVFWNSYSICTF